jgi:hypothetical protein
MEGLMRDMVAMLLIPLLGAEHMGTTVRLVLPVHHGYNRNLGSGVLYDILLEMDTSNARTQSAFSAEDLETKNSFVQQFLFLTNVRLKETDDYFLLMVEEVKEADLRNDAFQSTIMFLKVGFHLTKRFDACELGTIT